LKNDITLYIYKATLITKLYIHVKEERRLVVPQQTRNCTGKCGKKIQVKLTQRGCLKTYPAPKYKMKQKKTESFTRIFSYNIAILSKFLYS